MANLNFITLCEVGVKKIKRSEIALNPNENEKITFVGFEIKNK